MKPEVMCARRRESAWRYYGMRVQWFDLGVFAACCALVVAGLMLAGRTENSRAVSLPTCVLGEVASVATSGSWECVFDGDLSRPTGRTSISAADSATVYMTTEARYSDLADPRSQCRRNVRGGSGQLVGTYLAPCDEAGDLTILGFEPVK